MSPVLAQSKGWVCAAELLAAATPSQLLPNLHLILLFQLGQTNSVILTNAKKKHNRTLRNGYESI